MWGYVAGGWGLGVCLSGRGRGRAAACVKIVHFLSLSLSRMSFMSLCEPMELQWQKVSEVAPKREGKRRAVSKVAPKRVEERNEADDSAKSWGVPFQGGTKF